jgi:hypothetical protein
MNSVNSSSRIRFLSRRTELLGLGIRVALVILVSLNTEAIGEEMEDLTVLDIEALMELDVDLNTVSALTSHIHKQGEWMFGYHYMPMYMDGNRKGTSDMKTSEVLADYMVAPTKMDMEMHMFSAMYAFTDKLTAMAMVTYDARSMDHVNRMGMTFTTESSGFGDLSVMTNYVVHKNPIGNRMISIRGGISVPVGSIDEKDRTPMGVMRLPYPMQLGSGTYDLMVGIDYQWFSDQWSTGVQAQATTRTGDNDNDYTLGDLVEVNARLSYEWTDWVVTSLMLKGSSWGDINGADPQLNMSLVPTAVPSLRGGSRVDLSLDVELYAVNGRLQGNRFAIQVGLPVYEDLDGPQLSTDYTGLIGWQMTF